VQHAKGQVEAVDPVSGAVFTRSSEVLRAADGRYHVTVKSLDGSGAAEQVAYDGRGLQTVLITEPGGHQEAYLVEGDAHFAILGDSTAARGWNVSEDRDGIVVSATFGSPTAPASSYQAAVDLNRVRARTVPASALEVAIPQEVTLTKPFAGSLEGLPGPDDDPLALSVPLTGAASTGWHGSRTAARHFATGSASQNMWDIWNQGNCVYAYNYRNNVSNFFTANSQPRGICAWVDVSVWRGGVDGAGSCWGTWLGGGPTSSVYSSKTGYWDPNPPSHYRMCSNHAGWTSGWALVVPWNGLNASVPG
jgi:hypothetical protein